VPLPPFLQLALFSNESRLQAMWNRSFTMSDFPITSYSLDVVNKTNGDSRKIAIDQNLTETITYDLLSSGLPLSCHALSFSLTATNSVGESRASNIATSGFSICKRNTYCCM
jgi:hypothetical protein